jgi:hypothetical protein
MDKLGSSINTRICKIKNIIATALSKKPGLLWFISFEIIIAFIAIVTAMPTRYNHINEIPNFTELVYRVGIFMGSALGLSLLLAIGFYIKKVNRIRKALSRKV